MGKKEKHWSEKELKTHDGEVLLTADVTSSLRQWVEGDPRVFFKSSTYDFASTEGELLYHYLAKIIDLEVVDPRPAILVKLNSYARGTFLDGVAVKDFLTNREKQEFSSMYKIYLASNLQDTPHNIETNLLAVENYVKKIERDEKKRVVYNIKDFYEFYIKMYLLDLLTLQSDRHLLNAGVIVTSSEKYIELTPAPVYDNAAIFNFPQRYQDSYENILGLIKSQNWKGFGWRLDFFAGYGFLLNESSQGSITSNPDNYIEGVFNETGKLLAKSSFAHNILDKLSKVDFQKISKQIERDMPGYKIDPDKVLVASHIFAHQLNKIKRYSDKFKGKEESFKNYERIF